MLDVDEYVRVGSESILHTDSDSLQLVSVRLAPLETLADIVLKEQFPKMAHFGWS